MTPLVQIVYVSTAVRRLTAVDMAHIVAAAERRNLEDGITGVLLLRQGRFVQVLEGPVPQVDRCFERIAMDDRHIDLVRTLRASIDHRSFPHWSMRMVPFDGAGDPAVGEFFGALRGPGSARQAALAAELLRQLNFGRAGSHERFS